jgi:hypothetical protein
MLATKVDSTRATIRIITAYNLPALVQSHFGSISKRGVEVCIVIMSRLFTLLWSLL